VTTPVTTTPAQARRLAAVLLEPRGPSPRDAEPVQQADLFATPTAARRPSGARHHRFTVVEQLNRSDPMPDSLSPRLARAVAKILHQLGDPTDDGRLAIRPEEVGAEIAKLDFARLATKDDKADPDDDGEEGGGDYDPVEAGRAAGRKVVAERERRQRDALR
jgi:hypothetical protein